MHRSEALTTVLIVDDSAETRWVLSELVKRSAGRAIVAQDGSQALARLAEEKPDIVFLDLVLPDIKGLELLKRLLDQSPWMPVLVITGHASVTSAVEAMKLGAYDYVTKPFDNKDLVQRLQKATEHVRRVQHLESLQEGWVHVDHLCKMMGHGPAVQRLHRQLEVVASSKLSVLICGESGVGKEVVARTIHHRSPWRSGPFVALDCGGIPESLLESELFGHEKGAFTGADRAKQGAFVRAHGGTLFLDEISNLGYGMQAKLLRALQEREVQPLGSTTVVPVDLRVVASSNLDLPAEVKRSGFRLDLYHRLSEFTIEVPPLRDRKEDLPYLVERFIAEAAQELQRNVHSITPEALALLRGYDYPGNVRELFNIVRRAVLFAAGERVEAAAITFDATKSATSAEPSTNGGGAPVPCTEAFNLASQLRTLSQGATLNDLLESFAHQVVAATLQATSNNKSAAARLLKIDRKKLYQTLQRTQTVRLCDDESAQRCTWSSRCLAVTRNGA